MLDRRDLFKLGAIAGFAGLGTRGFGARRADLTLVFFTDVHIQPGMSAETWTAAALGRIADEVRPDFVVLGGDTLNGGRTASIAEAEAMMAQWERISAPTGLRFIPTLGNHDVVSVSGDKAEPDHPKSGKAMFRERFGLDQTYQSIDLGAAQLLVLDSVLVDEAGEYTGVIDAAQLEWLSGAVAAVPEGKPLLVSTHIPMFSIIPQYDAGVETPVPAWQLIRNAKAVKEILDTRNTLAVFQGHTHVFEACMWAGRWYLTGGAVCGNWWNGSRFGVDPPGYLVVTLTDGELDYQYVPYGWTPAEARSVALFGA